MVATASLPLLPLKKVMVDVLVQARLALSVAVGLERAMQSTRGGPKYWTAAVGKAVR